MLVLCFKFLVLLRQSIINLKHFTKMKKLILFTLTALSLSLTSCSDDDGAATNNGGNGGTFTATVNGVQKTYNTVTVSEDSYSDGEVYLKVTGSQEGSADENIYFEMAKNETGTNAIYYSEFTTAGVQYYAGNLNTNVTVNNANQVKGTFSGPIYNTNSTEQDQVLFTITNGTFTANY
jgi:hypothetical protein